LLSVTVCPTLADPTIVAGKLTCAGLASSRISGVPVPDRLTVATPGSALLPVTVSIALSTPISVGENVTWIEHVNPGVRATVQAVTSVGALSAKSAAFAPLTANVGTFIVSCPVFVTSTVNSPVEFPTTTDPICNAAGETESAGGVSPVPVSVAAIDATPTVLVETVKVAVTAPAATGVNTTETVQVAPAARLVTHVVALTPKLVAMPAVPASVIAKLGVAIGDPPLFVIVSVRAALAIFICSSPKSRAVPESASNAGLSAGPASDTVCARNASEMVSVAVSSPAAEGAKVTEIAHDARAASSPPQPLTAVKAL